MNLGQLIDPERAREGWGDARPAKPAPLPPRGTITHTPIGDIEEAPAPVAPAQPAPQRDNKRHSPKGLASRIRRLLAERPRLLLAEIGAGLGAEVSAKQVNNAVHWLVYRGDLQHEGARGVWRYSVTDQGRKAL